MNEKTRLEKLKWSISLLGTEKPYKDAKYIGEVVKNHPNRNELDKLKGWDIREYYDMGYIMSIDDYLTLVKRINPTYMTQVKSYINKTFISSKGTHNDFMDFIVDYFRDDKVYYTDYIETKWIKPMTNEVIERLLTNYYMFRGVKAGFLDEYEPTEYEFNDIAITKEEIIDTYILINGGYEWNMRNPTIDDFKKGQYVSVSFQAVRYISRAILQNEPELIGCRNITIERERIIDNILG